MQQPLAQQPEQMGPQTQALGQQMVLCPVRLVYETQILVQPGDHIQPNQTFFINPQNPPPWMQNSLQNSLQTRQHMPNQVVYVHQLPNNMVPSIQQPMDQNQLYLQQNFPNFQIQQQMLPQNPQEMRPAVQLANIVPNMVQNIQASVPNERTIQNRPIQANQQMIQNQIAVNRPLQNQIVNSALEVQGQVFMRPQMPQQANVQRPMMNVNQFQNIQQQTLANLQNVASNSGQTFIPNTVRASPNPRDIIRATVGNNIVSVSAGPKIREISPSNVEKPINSPIVNVAPNVRSFVPNHYRPIQPRPQIVQNVANTPKLQQHIPVQTVQNSPTYDHNKNTSNQNTTNNYAIIQELNNPSLSRKRKSESPDEVQKKMATASTLKHNYNTQSTVRPNYNPTQDSISRPHYYTVQHNVAAPKLITSSEIGTNTSPVHRPRLNPQFQTNSVPAVKRIDEPVPNVTKEMTNLQDKDKLIRNTVYTQARGRVLQDKVDETKAPQTDVTTKTAVQTNNVEEKQVESELRTDIELQQKGVEMPRTIPDAPVEADIIIRIVKETNKKDTETHDLEMPDIIKSAEEKIEKSESIVKHKPADIVPNDIKNLNQENSEKVVSQRNPIKLENIDILTHVVDGYVIQESNIAFPIRKPLKERTHQTNMKLEENEKKDLLRESIKEELKSNAGDMQLLPFHYLLLDSAKEEKEQAEEKEKEEARIKDDPFAQVQQSTVKSWTVDDLSAHLLKYNWKETVSLLQDHEIDGESLYLVSKQQLLTIGVAEEHANVICEFVKS